jgi:nucleoside-diphosphate-sugar epimerase
MCSNAAAGRLLQILNEESISLVNIGSGIERSISSVVQSIANHLGISEIEYSPNYISSISHRVLDISLLESVCGVYTDNFEQDLINTIEWYKSNRVNART